MNNQVVTVYYPAEKTYSFIVSGYMDIIEMIFHWCNNGSGQEHEAFLKEECRSLSVGDFVSVGDKVYRCDSFGWTEVNMDYVHERQQKVVNHPDFEDHGPWACNHRIHQDEVTI